VVAVLSEELAVLEVLLPKLIPNIGIDILSAFNELHVILISFHPSLDGRFNKSIRAQVS